MIHHFVFINGFSIVISRRNLSILFAAEVVIRRLCWAMCFLYLFFTGSVAFTQIANPSFEAGGGSINGWIAPGLDGHDPAGNPAW